MARLDPTDGELETNDGERLSTREEKRMLRQMWRFIAGRVLEAGLGKGWARRRLCEARHIRRLRTIELRQDVVDMWRAKAPLELDDFDPSPEDVDHDIEVNDIVTVLDREANRATKRFFGLVADIPEAVIDDGDFQDALRRLLSDPGQRVVLVYRNGEPHVPGFVTHRMQDSEYQEHTTLWTLTRWDPANGVGQEVGQGKLRIPGVGWVTP